MRINRLKLVDFRNHAETDITFERLTCVRGANRTGKSSIRQGLEFALTGRTDGTDARGAGAAGLIRQGADKATILLKLQANKEIDLKCTLTEASGRTVTVTDASDPAWNGAAVKQFLDDQRDVLSCLLNSQYFIKLKPAEQKSLLSSIILPDQYDWPQDIVGKAASVHLSINWDCLPFDVIEAAYKAAYDKRRDLGRDLKNLHIPDAIPMPEGVKSSADTQDWLAKARTRAHEVEKERRAKADARSSHVAKINGLENRVESLRGLLRTEQETLAQTEKAILSKAQLKDTQKLAANKEKYDAIEKDLATLREQAAGIRAIFAIFEKLAEKTCCPMCQRDVSEEWLGEKLSAQNDAARVNGEKQEALLDEQKALGDVSGAARRLEEHERQTVNQKRSRAIIAEKSALLQTAEKELDELRGTLPAEVPLDDPEVSDLRKQIATAEASLEAVAASEARAKEIQRAHGQKQKLEAALATLEELVKYFGPEGVKAQLLSEHIGTFTSSLNQGLAAWGYAAEFDIEPYGFRVKNLTTGAVLPLELLSGSERLRFAAAFQVALAQATNIRLVVIDEVDVLDSEGRSAFYPLLLEADLDQAIAIGTSESKDIPEVEGTAFYYMDAGQAQRLAFSEEAVAQ